MELAEFVSRLNLAMSNKGSRIMVSPKIMAIQLLSKEQQQTSNRNLVLVLMCKSANSRLKRPWERLVVNHSEIPTISSCLRK